MARVRSPNYPSLSLPSAIEAARKVFAKEHTHKADSVVVAKALGYGGLNGASLSALSALKKYGLLEEDGKQLRVSKSALSILVDPADSPERASEIVKAASMPQLFSDLRDQYGSTIPSDENLKSFLIKRGFAPTTVDAPIRAYRETMEFIVPSIALISGPSRVASSPLSEAPSPSFETPPPVTEAKASASDDRVALERRPDVERRQDVFSVEEGVVKIEWPCELSEASLQDITDWLAIVSRKIARSVQKP